jgi:hypothetical protein
VCVCVCVCVCVDRVPPTILLSGSHMALYSAQGETGLVVSVDDKTATLLTDLALKVRIPAQKCI